MEKVLFKTNGGQVINQNEDCRIHDVVIERVYEELPFDCVGVDSYTSYIYHESETKIKSWVLDWAYYPDEINFILEK